MIQKKICMLGSFAVGKTSLVRRYVDSMFSEKYTTTIGVKIDKKSITVNQKPMSLLLWDVYGEDSHQTVLPAYLRGMSAYVLVTDPGRPKTFQSAISLHQLVKKSLGDKPFIYVMNKADIKDQWLPAPEELTDELAQLRASAVATIETSAKEDFGVDEMFMTLASTLLPPDPINLSAFAAEYCERISATKENTTTLKINTDKCIVEHEGSLARCGVATVNQQQAVDEQIPLLAGLLPHHGEPLYIRNTQTNHGRFVDVHVLSEDTVQWVLFVDKTATGILQQAEQQVRLTSDIISENHFRDSDGDGNLAD